ncbi:glutamine synthetase III [Aureitalea marina]|uniref:Uncharacterized protein n=1 Tax=Aureitalea marina TaxID=930804 RepID=A0A2S7KRC3_9FLAO|nr:glutamine synthetase III [Aureitalea marina]PQB05171.1 hypothetical protein BST85_09960 [Aureitalea marina]
MKNTNPIRTQQTQQDMASFPTKISDIFGQDVFNTDAMEAYLDEDSYLAMIKVKNTSKRLDNRLLESIADGIKKWAMDKGATHFTHWFQPLTGGTAEKHDAFYKPSTDDQKKGIEGLTASELLQREPDASSFPSGGLRNTAEARGYTIWDPSSPVFILKTKNGKTLYIPSIFVSYAGESLGNKAPLLKSLRALEKAAIPVCRYFDPAVTSTIATLGWEQEYFLIDEALFRKRPDLALTGRTLIGAASAKGQECDDHYFGVIPERVEDFMKAYEMESLKLGIPVLTRHNEVAPSQYECAPVYEEMNVSTDHNLLAMRVLQNTAKKFGLRAILHEKPYKGLNGSGKHNNWSMATNTGTNLLAGGSNPESNLYFLTFFINVIKAVSTYADVLRASIATAGNDHRLGANEAPPAIISVFTGSEMAAILERFKTNGLCKKPQVKEMVLELDVPKIPLATLDKTDRNRTSPFPFIGNRFEFRAVGSSASCSLPMTTLNTMVAEQLSQFYVSVEDLKEKGTLQEDAIVEVLQQYVNESEGIIFNGNGYDKQWQAMAQERGLANIKSTPYALEGFNSENAKSLFANQDVLSKRETQARYEVMQQDYINKIQTEADSLIDLIQTYVLPSVASHLKDALNIRDGFTDMGLFNAAQTVKNELEVLADFQDNVRLYLCELKGNVLKAQAIKDTTRKSKFYADQIQVLFDPIRENVDEIEKSVSDQSWRLPKYRDMLFI